MWAGIQNGKLYGPGESKDVSKNQRPTAKELSELERWFKGKVPDTLYMMYGREAREGAFVQLLIDHVEKEFAAAQHKGQARNKKPGLKVQKKR
jgi:hypothetical protein